MFLNYLCSTYATTGPVNSCALKQPVRCYRTDFLYFVQLWTIGALIKLTQTPNLPRLPDFTSIRYLEFPNILRVPKNVCQHFKDQINSKSPSLLSPMCFGFRISSLVYLATFTISIQNQKFLKNAKNA